MSCPYLFFGNINFEATNQYFPIFGNIFYEATREAYLDLRFYLILAIIAGLFIIKGA